MLFDFMKWKYLTLFDFDVSWNIGITSVISFQNLDLLNFDS